MEKPKINPEVLKMNAKGPVNSTNVGGAISNEMKEKLNSYPSINLQVSIPTKLDIRAHTVLCLLNFIEFSRRSNLNVNIQILPGKSNIDQARSMMISKWYDRAKNPNDLFFFLDSDQTFVPDDVVKLCKMIFDKQNPCDVACGGYSRSDGSLILGPENFVEFIKGTNNKLVYGATGFMLIKRSILIKVHDLIKTMYPDKKDGRYWIDIRHQDIVPFFKQMLLPQDKGISGKSNEWLSEDYSFCYLVRKVGGIIRGFVSPTIGHVVPQTLHVDINRDIQKYNDMVMKISGGQGVKKIPINVGSNGMAVNNLTNKGVMNNSLINKSNSLNNQNRLLNAPNQNQQKRINVMWSNKSIVFFTGQTPETWGPSSLKNGIGGSETAVLELSRWFSKKGWEVSIYGHFTKELITGEIYKDLNKDTDLNTNNLVNSNNLNDDNKDKEKLNNISDDDISHWKNVKFLPFQLFNIKDAFNILILWRCPQLAKFIESAKTILVDMHDLPRIELIDDASIKNIDMMMVKSNYHEKTLEKAYGLFHNDAGYKKITVIPNGGTKRGKMIANIDINDNSDINDNKKVNHNSSNSISRNITFDEILKIKDNCHNKLIYCSSYDRGLFEILNWGWPIINEKYPDAELHIYYGWNTYDKYSDATGQRKLYKQVITDLINKYPNVHEHGRIGKNLLMRAKLYSNIHYYTGIFEEIDCISVRESMSVGCLPVVSNLAAFTDKRKDYIMKLSGSVRSKQYQEKCANEIVNLLKDKDKLNELRSKYYNSKNLENETWENISNEWISVINKFNK